MDDVWPGTQNPVTRARMDRINAQQSVAKVRRMHAELVAKQEKLEE